MIGPLRIQLDDYDVSHENGFLPNQLPLKQLDKHYYHAWEDIVQTLPHLLRADTLRARVDSLPTLSTMYLSSDMEWRRAYLLLSFITHAYIWGVKMPSQRLPSAVSVPFTHVSAHLGLPPTATYSAFNLWNFTTSSSTGDFIHIENLSSLHTFTGTADEEWFYLISVAMEARGGKIIRISINAFNAIRSDDVDAVGSCLLELADSIHEIGEILRRMHEKCSPDIFYHQIRPYLAGSKNMAAAGLPNGVFYEDLDGGGSWRHYNGGSNAQSSLVQLLDVVLGVEHLPTKTNRITKTGKSSFLQEMRDYMPAGHRRFLQHIESLANIREYVSKSAVSEVLTAAYNLAVSKLATFRDIHLQIVARYIIAPSKRTSAAGLSGTGGTELMPFLKQSRNETRNSIVDDANCNTRCKRISCDD